MTKRVSITLNDAQQDMLQSYADAMGMPLAYAARMAMLQPLMDWHARAMNQDDRPKTLVEQEREQLAKEFG